MATDEIAVKPAASGPGAVPARSLEEGGIADEAAYASSVARFRELGILLPTFAELAEPSRIPPAIVDALADLDPDELHPLNLFRVHWHNGAGRRRPVEVPEHLVLPASLTGVGAKIVLLLGNRFPLIRAHKVLAAYACLAPSIITGRFDPARHKAVWPSTGNYGRGGVAISRMMGCRGVVVLPQGMSSERFRWLERWVEEPEDIVRTPGSESNVKEIFDRCAELARDPGNVVFDQFREFGNYLVHRLSTGRALERVFEALHRSDPALRLRAFVAATGSAGTLAAGDHLKERYGSLTVAAEALECPTLLYNGFGEHSIQGIGDKHVPLIHNVMATDVVTAVSDASTDALDVLFNTPVGRRYLVERRGVPRPLVASLGDLGLSSLCNVIAAIKTAKRFDLGERDAVVTVATDGAELYASGRAATRGRLFPAGFDEVAAAEVYGQHLLGVATDHFQELSHRDRQRIFNLGYFTWVEQQGVPLPEFTARAEPEFWRRLQELVPSWDRGIAEFNRRTGLAP